MMISTDDALVDLTCIGSKTSLCFAKFTTLSLIILRLSSATENALGTKTCDFMSDLISLWSYLVLVSTHVIDTQLN